MAFTRLTTAMALLAGLALQAAPALAHDPAETPAGPHARYIANEGVLVVAPTEDGGETKILFDPLFHNSYGQYRLPSEDDRAAMLAGAPPFDGVDIVFISHAHGDHFDAEDMNAYLAANGDAVLVAPAQAVAQMRAAENWDEALAPRAGGVALGFGDAPVSMTISGVEISAVRIPHAGWPSRADVENLVYRVTLSPDATVMHLGDADANDGHYAPYDDHWARRETDIGFPPYWFFSSAETMAIVKDRLRVKHAVGVHVPEAVPPGLEAARAQYGVDFFSVPGEVREFFIPDEGSAE